MGSGWAGGLEFSLGNPFLFVQSSKSVQHSSEQVIDIQIPVVKQEKISMKFLNWLIHGPPDKN